MNNLLGKLVVSKKGRDEKNIYMIFSTNGNFCYLVDGKYHKIENPKKKNLKHIDFLGAKSEKISEKIEKKLKIFDSEVFSFIKNYKND